MWTCANMHIYDDELVVVLHLEENDEEESREWIKTRRKNINCRKTNGFAWIDGGGKII